MKRKLLRTGDGSYTLHIPEWNEQYHSKNGALAEALHVFIQKGLQYWYTQNRASEISILEIGFGTGLNCILTYLESKKNGWKTDYTGVEAFPLDTKEVHLLDFPAIVQGPYPDVKTQHIYEIVSIIHDAPWEKRIAISEHFALTKQQKLFSEISDLQRFNLIYFDAFGIRVQPELWTESIFQKMYNALKNNGVLVTYAANGKARRAMQNVGFSVSRLPGPPGKREMLRAYKN